MVFRRVMVGVLAFCVLAALIPTSAFAGTLKLRVEDLSAPGSPNGYGVVITDNLPGDAAIQDGIISVMLFGLSNNVVMSLTLGMSKPQLPGEGVQGVYSQLFLQSFNLTTSSAATVRLTLEDTGYTGGVGQGPLTLSNSIGGNFAAPAGSTLTTRSWADATNEVPALGGPISGTPGTPASLSAIGANATGGTTQTFTSTGMNSSFSGTEYAQFEATGTTTPYYSLYTQVVMTFSGAGNISFSQDTMIPTPEPGTLLLIGTGIAGLARMSRRRALRVQSA